MTPNVLDISHHNTINSFAALKAAGILGIIHKCTQGSGYVDPMYEPRRKLATDAGLLWGAYSFNTGVPVKDQLDLFISHANPDAQTLMALDFEDNPASQMTLPQAKQFLSDGGDRLGRKLVLYSGNRIKDLLGGNISDFFGEHRLWLAQYGPRAVVQKSWRTQWLWQFSESGRLSGTDGALDFNYFDGSPSDLATEWAS